MGYATRELTIGSSPNIGSTGTFSSMNGTGMKTAFPPATRTSFALTAFAFAAGIRYSTIGFQTGSSRKHMGDFFNASVLDAYPTASTKARSIAYVSCKLV